MDKKDIDKDIVARGMESAFEDAARKHIKNSESISYKFDRDTGESMAMRGGAGDRPIRTGSNSRSNCKSKRIF